MAAAAYDPTAPENQFPKYRHRLTKEKDPEKRKLKPFDAIVVKTPEDQEENAPDSDGWTDDIEGVLVNVAPPKAKPVVAPTAK